MSAPIDFVIITALEEERNAMLAHLPGHRRLERKGEDPNTYYEASVQTSRSDGARYRVLVTQLLGTGPANAASKATAVVAAWAPRHVLFVGIAGGLKSIVSLGDVLVANQIADYTGGKRTPERRIIRWEVHRADATLLDAVSHLPEGWEHRTIEPRPEAGRPRRHIGVILSGGDVLADGDTLREQREMWDKLIGVEMEGGGTALALHQTSQPPRFLMIRGASDMADPRKYDADALRWRSYACDVAAAYTVAFLEAGPVPAA
jgi:nucleoside phosphorylase